MRRFRLAVYEENGNWLFRWSNISEPEWPPLLEKIIGPCKDRQEAEAEKQKFIAAEKDKPGTVFEEA
jgi:hypothetical protein